MTNEVDIWRNYQYFWHHLKLYFGLLNIHIPSNLSCSTFIFFNQSLYHVKILSSRHLGNSRLCIYVFMNFFIFQPRVSFHIETSNLFCSANKGAILRDSLQSWKIKKLLQLPQKQPLRGVPRKWCSENMQQIYRRAPMPKYDFNKVALQLYWNHASAWVFCKFAAYFQNTFSQEHLWVAASVTANWYSPKSLIILR